VEYSEISSNIAEARNADGRLTFNAGSICNHLFSLNFLKLVCTGKRLKHHVAQKKIPFVDAIGNLVKPEKPNGVKLEKFVFDVFQFTDRFVVWDVVRDEEFAPMKNANTASKDTPNTARQALSNLHRNYVLRAGGTFVKQLTDNVKESGGEVSSIYLNGKTNCNGSANIADQLDPSEAIVEISPLLSYDGEGLRGLVAGKQLTSPLVLYSEKELIQQKKESNQQQHVVTEMKETNIILNGVH